MRVKTIYWTTITLITLVFFIGCGTEPKEQLIDLSGSWLVKLDPENTGENAGWYMTQLEGELITLPATLDEAGIGTPNTLKPVLNNYVLSHLTRKNSYTGKAWYQRSISIPPGWAGKTISLMLERVLWTSEVWIDEEKVPSIQESLITPHYFDLSNLLSPGDHTITILVNNGNRYPGINVAGNKYPAPEDKDMAHAYTNHTQIKWNGILGELTLKAYPAVAVEQVQVYPYLDQNRVKVSGLLSGVQEGDVKIEILKDGEVKYKTTASISRTSFSTEFDAGFLEKWSEFNPITYECRVSVASHQKAVTFGYRNFTNENAVLAVNGQRTFMRGNLECVIFPLTGRPPMDKKGWMSLMDTARAYGLNHLRFHSWCPPKAAFEVADEIGMYLQVELPLWNLNVGRDEATNDFLYSEAKNLIREYGNHPSFVFFSVGNELEGDPAWLNGLVAEMKVWDDRHLYTTTTFSFQKDISGIPQSEDEYFVTQWTKKGWVRGQGVFNQNPPNFSKNFTNNMDYIGVPLISHEIGQYSVYPDLSEMEKYTGVLEPLNFEAVKIDLQQKGLLDFAPEFTMASGKLAALLYKEEIERALRTPEFDGFQLLQLQDFPGQGTALVGLLNAFWESKGAINAAEFSEFCAPVVPLLSFEKAVYKSGETFKAHVIIANFKQPIDEYAIRWKIMEGEKKLFVGDLRGPSLDVGNENIIGEISANLSVDKAVELEIQVEVLGTPYKNRWKIWVYPEESTSNGNILYTRSFSEAKKGLSEGKKVLFNPDYRDIQGVTGRFVPVFWSPVHFPDQPSTMGILCDPEHGALADFPTEFHANWQWWDLNINSKALNLNDLDPIVRVIDNFVTNRSLGILFEAKVGTGKLILTSIDLANDLDKRIVARQMKRSLLSYMSSDDFAPVQTIDFSKIELLKN